MSFNIINLHDIPDYLRKFTDSEDVAKLLTIALENPLRKRAESIRIVTELPVDAPEWLKHKWDTRSEWHEFYPEKDIRLPGRIAYVARWIAASIQNKEAWLDKTDHKGRPTKLVKIGTLQQAVSIALKYEDFIQNKYDPESQADVMNVDISFIYQVNEDIHVVKLLTPKALDRESQFLDHCIGNDGYDSALLNRESVFYSFRDKNNKPLMTLQADYLTKRLVQCRTRNNGRATDQLLDYLNIFAKKQGIYSNVMVCDFYLYTNGEFSNDLHNLSHLETISGELVYHNPSEPVTFSKKLTFNGSLSFYGYNFKKIKLPSYLNVEQNLSFVACPFLKALPKQMIVGNNFDLAYCPLIEELPKLQRLSGYYHICNCENLERIMGDVIDTGHGVHIDSCPKLNTLPQTMISQDFVSICNCPSLTELPQKLHAKRGLRIFGCEQLQTLPDDFYVKGLIYTEFGVFDNVDAFRMAFHKQKRLIQS